jgi:cytochrome b involved in lipid metabolism
MSIRLDKDYSNNTDPDKQKNHSIEDLLQKNLELTQEIFKMVKSIKSYVLWARIGGFLKFLLIVVPLVAGTILLSPFLKDAYKQYQDLVGIKTDSEDLIKNFGINQDNVDVEKLKSLVK